MSLLEGILIVASGFLIGLLFLGIFLHKKKLARAFEMAQNESANLLERAQKEADRIIKQAIHEGKEESKRRRKNFEEEAKKKKSELQKLELKLKQREQNIQEKVDQLDKKEKKCEKLEEKLLLDEKKNLRLQAECQLVIEQNQKTLEKTANMSAEEARKKLLESLKESATKEAKKIYKDIELKAKKEAKQKSKEIISLAIQRTAGEFVNDSTITVVQLPSDEMKGRIIGREGRNIRAIEQATGVDLIIDDTPEAVIISCFNPIKREIAKLTLEKLIADGRIHPARIDETVERVEKEMDDAIKEYGEQACFDVGVTDLHPQLIYHLGKLRFRSKGLQSVLQHCVETAHISAMMAAELKLDSQKAKRAGLLHDIGKAASHTVEGDHSTIGADLCKQYGEIDEIIEAVKFHHGDDLSSSSPLTVLVGAANNLSGNRPGARKELLASYIKRLEDIETLVSSFEHVEKSYVLQAGREVRVMVSSQNMSDTDVSDLSSDIASKLRQELTFPGQISITVIKESKYVEYAT